MGKIISSYKELVNVCNSAALWYVGSYMIEFIMNREKWENNETKQEFIRYMYEEYGGADADISGTTTRVNAMIKRSKRYGFTSVLFRECSNA